MIAVPAGDKLPLICVYMQDKIGVEFKPDTCQGFAVLSDTGAFVGAVLVSNVLYFNGRPVNCEISCSAESGMAWRPHVCRAIFQYVFGQLGCVRATSITRKNNTKARTFLEALNFQLEGRIRKGYDGERDALVYGLLASECQFFGALTDGQEHPESTSSAGPGSDG